MVVSFADLLENVFVLTPAAEIFYCFSANPRCLAGTP
jgi:hypothetical protein